MIPNLGQLLIAGLMPSSLQCLAANIMFSGKRILEKVPVMLKVDTLTDIGASWFHKASRFFSLG